ncbi:hypothetical protein OHV05_10105 [Kitasatospora sp. NBC_00070]|uniref:hypothetical protein n=1 Tax=Kitasatospora sp. NBC_00070 TaxID=2975962 RepID=UPI0032561528
MTVRPTSKAPAVVAGALGPAPYGLTRTEVRAELRRLTAAGFQLWELRRLFGHPRQWQTPSPTTNSEKEVAAW